MHTFQGLAEVKRVRRPKTGSPARLFKVPSLFGDPGQRKCGHGGIQFPIHNRSSAVVCEQKDLVSLDKEGTLVCVPN